MTVGPTQPHLVVATHQIPKIPDDALHIIMRILTSAETARVRKRFDDSAEKFDLLANKRALGHNKLLPAIAKMANDMRDVSVSLAGITLRRLDAAIMGLAEATEMETLRLDVGILDRAGFTSTAYSLNRFFSRVTTSFPAGQLSMSLKSAACYSKDWRHGSQSAKEMDQFLNDLIAQDPPCLKLLSLQIPASSVSAPLMNLLRLVRCTTSIKRLHVTMQTLPEARGLAGNGALFLDHLGFELDKRAVPLAFGLNADQMPPALVFKHASEITLSGLDFGKEPESEQYALRDSLVNCLKETRSLKQLGLHRTRNAGLIWDALCEAIAHNRSLFRLDISQFSINAENFSALLTACIVNNRTIQQVHFWGYSHDFSFLHAELTSGFTQPMGRHPIGIYFHLNQHIPMAIR